MINRRSLIMSERVSKDSSRTLWYRSENHKNTFLWWNHEIIQDIHKLVQTRLKNCDGSKQFWQRVGLLRPLLRMIISVANVCGYFGSYVKMQKNHCWLVLRSSADPRSSQNESAKVLREHSDADLKDMLERSCIMPPLYYRFVCSICTAVIHIRRTMLSRYVYCSNWDPSGQ